MPEAVERLVNNRLVAGGVHPEAKDAFAELIKNQLSSPVASGRDTMSNGQSSAARNGLFSGRVLLLLDGWDELKSTEEEPVKQAVQAWAAEHPVVLTSRPFVDPADAFPAALVWDLLPLAAPERTADRVHRWFRAAGEEHKADQMLKKLEGRPQLAQQVRVPLLGALLCWMWDKRYVPPLPADEARLLLKGLELLLRRCRPAKQSVGAALGERPSAVVRPMLESLAEMACNTLSGQRWEIGDEELDDLWKQVSPHRQWLFASRAESQEALTGRFGLFSKVAEAQYEIIHQSFAEVLAAWYLCEMPALETEAPQRGGT